ncbi:MAG: transcriptional activator NhaR [Rhodocyclaceae bacterium]|nr:transcriptional activator NhaR [Rhodocyclaceae bacterium]MBX3676732.1 transcriptional activator NhaR [Rhodocyclaceae bacterium]MCB1890679.1 transcriptional activator NhaR [Rhodocyclaceae bacterium]
MSGLNYKHLRYFWTVAKAGGIARACERLHLTPQTISGQLSVFEAALGHKLFARTGRRLELTEAGRMVLSYADEIFTVGEELEDALRHQGGGMPLQFKVGVADSVPKSVAYRLLEPAVSLPEPLRIVCREGKLASLMADLAIHRLDLVISDGPMPAGMSIRGFNHLLGESGLTFFAAPSLARRHKGRFPGCLDGAPMLLPGEEAAVRPGLMNWLEGIAVHPIIVGEFDDGALMKAFGKAGIGIFAAPSAIAGEVRQQYGVVPIGSTHAVTERFYAISVERRLTHPAVVAISSAAREELFARKRNG